MHYLITKNQYLNKESLGYLNLKSVSTLKTDEILSHKLRKTKLFLLLYYMHYCMSYFRDKKRKQNILRKHFQNKHLCIYAFAFLSFYFHTIRRFCFPTNTNADIICNVIEGFK